MHLPQLLLGKSLTAVNQTNFEEQKTSATTSVRYVYLKRTTSVRLELSPMHVSAVVRLNKWARQRCYWVKKGGNEREKERKEKKKEV